MASKKVSGAQFIDELNKAYEKTAGYDSQNRFKPPNGAAAGNGIEIGFGPFSLWTPAHTEANQKVSEEFEFDPDA